MTPIRFSMSSRLLAVVVTLAAITCGQHVQAEIYKTVDKNGKVTFTDQVAPNAEQVKVREPNSSEPVKVRPPQSKPTAGQQGAYKVTILSPQDRQQFPKLREPISVTTSVAPKLPQGFRLRLMVDGNSQGVGTDTFKVNPLGPGDHTLMVEVIGPDDKAVANSATTTITVHTGYIE